ncbi:MAG: DNA polymerase IV [bacterium]|nr:DNA polymerase IV [bacterium]
MRKILHIDANSYFATLEQQAHPNLRGKPIGVAGKGKGERTVICAASIEAKKFGLKSGMSTWEALRLCPQLIIIPATYDRYSFTSKRIFDLLERFGPKVDVFSIDEAFLELDSDIGWDDARIIAKRIKALIRTEIGEWVSVSIGISYGKTLAKLASEMQKPDGLTVIRPEDFQKIAAVTPIEELCGIGFRLRPRLNRMGINTIADLGRMPRDMLRAVFGDHTGSWLHQIGNGQDSSIIHSWRSLPQEKSIGHSYTLPHNISNMADVKKVLLLLSERVGVRLRAKHLVGRTVLAYLRFEDGSGWGERHTQKEYLLDGYQIYQAGERLLNGLRQTKPVRLVAITVSDLVSQYEATSPLFEATQATEDLAVAVDKINNRYGEWTVHRGLIHKIRQRIFNLPDGRDKRKFVPEITSINPFTKWV